MEGDAELAACLAEGEEFVPPIAAGVARVPPLMARLVTWQRMSLSEPLVCRGMSGWSSTMSNSAWLACSRLSRRSSVALVRE